jgi:hypothetical protein
MYVSDPSPFVLAFTDIHRFVLPDFPSTTKWLTPEERSLAAYRLREGSGAQDEERGSLVKGVWMAVTDYKVWLLAYGVSDPHN